MSEGFTQVEERGIAIYLIHLRKRHKSDGGYINPILGRGGDPEGTARIMAETYRLRNTYTAQRICSSKRFDIKSTTAAAVCRLHTRRSNEFSFKVVLLTKLAQ